jgi:inner membrane protein involved in colicin E2 resistance
MAAPDEGGFRSTWLSDYIVNNLEECVSEQDEDLEMEMG